MFLVVFESYYSIWISVHCAWFTTFDTVYCFTFKLIFQHFEQYVAILCVFVFFFLIVIFLCTKIVWNVICEKKTAFSPTFPSKKTSDLFFLIDQCSDTLQTKKDLQKKIFENDFKKFFFCKKKQRNKQKKIKKTHTTNKTSTMQSMI